MELKQWLGRRVDSGEVVKVTVYGETIRSVECVEESFNGDSEAYQQNIPWISPGWIDLQVNGYGGYDFNGEHTTEQDVIGALMAMLSSGVTSCLPTIITGSCQRLTQAFETLSKVCDEDQEVGRSLIGFHLEGPYISEEDGPRGAHMPAYIRDPDLAEFAAWQRAADGRIRKVTLAPERQGAATFISTLVDQGVVAAIGHTAATQEQLEQAVRAGATMSTHLGNGAHPLIQRHPNYIWDQLADDRLWAGLIADGHHLPPNTLKAMLRAKQDKAILVSDAVRLAGMAPGRYHNEVNGEVELHENGRLNTVANPDILAGSASSLADGIANVVGWGFVSLAEAIEMVTIRPAKLLGMDQLGRLESGAVANLTLFDYNPEGRQPETAKLHIRETVLAGRSVYGGRT